ncbi:MAG: glycosyltransferase [Clostridium sp.]|nr:glycosyltransferase [Acetatifactor muris]MCM1525801.1 glycosyltransferase [Bacteroides sp.]MCM1564057.1 glycosyltransferase [Clostridium sp.]
MRILQINSHYNQGGAARIVACIHRQLLQDGEDSYVAFGRGVLPSETNVYRFDHRAEIYWSALVSRVGGVNGWSNRAATRRLLRFVDKVQPDVIHLHALHGYYLNFPMLFDYINARDIPCVWTFHDCHAFVGNCGYYFECRRWQEGCGNCPRLLGYPASLFWDFTSFMWRRKKELFTAGERKVIVTPSDWLTEEAGKSFFKKYPCMTIRNGIDTENTFFPRNRQKCREKYGYRQEDKLILGIAVGYGDPRKGAKYIIQTAKDLAAEAKVILVGWEKKNDTMLKDCQNVIPIPATDSVEALAEYYSMADVFVLPSLAENYATVSLESMACGTPVVGFDAGGIPEQLTKGRGIAVRAGDQQAFTEAVRKALGEGSGLLKGEALASLIREENSTAKMTEEYRRLYQSLLTHQSVREDQAGEGRLADRKEETDQKPGLEEI